jgi:hypothetical protein
VLIDVRGDSVLISESLDAETIQRAEDDFWPAESSGKETPGKETPAEVAVPQPH